MTLVVEDASGAALSSPVSVEAIADGCLLWTRRLAGRQSRCRVPAIAWFRVHAPGYRAATRSIFYDFEPLRAACTHLGLTPAQKAVALATPEPFERIRSLLNDVQLQVVLRS